MNPVSYQYDVIKTRLSLAVWLTDEYTGKEPSGHVRATLKEGGINSFMNLSGYHFFTDLAAGKSSLLVESASYFPVETEVVLPRPDPKEPVIEVILKPGPSYPFPANATLVRGGIKGVDAPVVGAEVKVVGKTIETLTDERGEFVIFFKGTKKESISIEIKKDGTTKTVNTTIEEGKTVSLGVVSFP